uniref:Endonuclease/exonuclease/phosphatase domain-containing protein n=1 Tax=Cajanus cajan TaxID=3821 RepID=A0A151TBL6_CAJCA|nr:hypothetical protein KK1_019039 [Cajanus cajan]
MIKDLAKLSNLPWCLVGDFNDILDMREKKGKTQHPAYLINGFRQTTLECNLLDIPLEGYPYTWRRGKAPPDLVEERLDRAMVTPNWKHTFPDSSLRNGIAGKSDHTPIWLKLNDFQTNSISSHFRFENMWLEDPDLTRAVNLSWDPFPSNKVDLKIAKCGHYLSSWGKKRLRKVRENIEHIKKEMIQCRSHHQILDWTRFSFLQRQLNNKLFLIEISWQ